MPRKSESKLDTKIIHSLDKGLQVLEMVATSDGEAGLSDLTGKLKWDKSTVFRLLTTLIRRGYVEQDPDTKRYRLGFQLLHLEHHLFKSLDLSRISREILARLAGSTGEAAHLATLHGDRLVIIAQRESPERVAVNAHVGSIEPLHCTALGKAILMQLSGEAFKGMLGGTELTSYTAKTITSRRRLLNNVRKARSLGCAVDDEEFDPQVRCIAAPAIMPRSRQFYAIGISGPSSRVTSVRIRALAKHVLAAADEFSRQFGGKTSEPGA